MVKLTFIQPDGTRQTLDVLAKGSVMEAARYHGVEGIRAECGGACACATCHVIVDPVWIDRLAPPEEVEKAMLEFAVGVEPSSRLSCQIPLQETLDGMIMRLPSEE